MNTPKRIVIILSRQYCLSHAQAGFCKILVTSLVTRLVFAAFCRNKKQAPGRVYRPGWVAFRNPFADCIMDRAGGATRHEQKNPPKACLSAEIDVVYFSERRYSMPRSFKPASIYFTIVALSPSNSGGKIPF
jgi:hypothetical protein